MKDKSEQEIFTSEENFRKYLLLVKEMADRIESEINPETIDDWSQTNQGL